MTAKFSIGIDLGGTNVKGILLGSDGKVHHRMKKAIRDQPKNKEMAHSAWKKVIYDMVRALKTENDQPVEAFGLVAPGIANRQNDRIEHMPGRLEGLEHFDWSNFLRENTAVLNDGHAALVAESAWGVGKGYKNLIMLTLGTGVGGAVMIDGRLYQGNKQRAGHLGHLSLDSEGPADITGIPGSLEDAIGDSTVSRRSLGRFASTDTLVEAYTRGDLFATYLWLEAVRKLSLGISSLINAFSPELVILGGGITSAGKALFEPLEKFMEIYEWRPGGCKTPIEKASLGGYAGAIGAATFAMKAMSDK